MTSPAPLPVLIVDDDARKRFAIRAAIAPLGCSIVEASSGRAAIECVRSRDFAVILLDVSMPTMDGIETAAAIREQPRSALTPIIYITAFGRSEVPPTDLYAHGAVDFIHAPIGTDELQAKIAVFASLYTNAAALEAKARRAEEVANRLENVNVELAAIARRDALTGLPNRRALSEDLEALEARVARYGHRYCMAVSDVDYFKGYNDSYGHQAGDEVLQMVAARLTDLLRCGDSVYRYGGEEFLCIFAEQSLESGLLAAERMRTGIQDLAVVHPTNPLGVLTMSGGVAILESGGRGSSSHVLKQADEALYRAKRLGRNRVEPAEVAAPVMASADRAPIRLDGPRRTSPSPR